MKTIDFDELGGYPLCQDDVEYMQTAYTECVEALAAAGVNGGAPVILYGMQGIGTGTMTDGAFIYNGHIVKFTGGSVTLGAGEVEMVVITNSASDPLPFNDGSTPNYINDSSGSFSHSAPVTDATHFPTSSLVKFGKGFGINNKELPASITATVGIVGATINYVKNWLSNTVAINLFLAVNTPASGDLVDANVYRNMGTLPAGFRPTINTPFTLICTANNAWQITGAGTVYLPNLTGYVDTTGNVWCQILKPAGTPPNYLLVGNFEMPLD